MWSPDFSREKGYLDKWEVHQVLGGVDIGGDCQVPETGRLDRLLLEQFLGRYGSVYIKPLRAWGGQDICKLVAGENGFHWMCQGRVEWQVTSAMDQLYDELTLIYGSDGAIIQGTAPVVTYGGCPFDIRVHMQKTLDDEWVLAGMLARVGGKDGIVSNVGISKGRVQPVETILDGLWPEQLAKHQSILSSLREVGHRVCEIIEQCRDFDEIGLDLGLDVDGGLWLFEVNTNDAGGGPSHELFAQLPDRRIYEAMMDRVEARKQGTLDLLLGELFASFVEDDS